ncbi:MAG: hypothetical protein MUF83_20955 [Acidimicrobiales bacterium]|jgi:WD40 repeat protein|nr:hypothetical protein [Acidimicrobiales bacterium]
MAARTRTVDRVELTWATNLDDYITLAAPSPDGTLLLTGSLSGRAALLDTTTGTVMAELALHDFGVLAGGWSHDGTHLATTGHDHHLRIYPAADPTHPIDVDLPGEGASVAWSPTEDLVAVAAGRHLTVADNTGTTIATWGPLPSTITAVAWSTNGLSVGAACYGGLHWYRPTEPERPEKHFAWKGSLLSIDPAPDGRWVAAGCQDAAAHIWRLWSGDDMQMSGYPAKIEHVAWHPSSRYLAIGSVGEITIWFFAGRGPQGTRPTTLDAHTRHVTDLAYRPDGQRLASGDANGDLYLWAPPKRTSPTSHANLGSSVSTLAWHPDGSHLYAGGADGTITAIATTT